VINVKKNQLTKAVMAALVFVSSSVLAESDYPAADFQPKVVYSDEGAQSASDSKPAAAKQVEEADPNFPAANYQPKVLFSDKDYKHSAAAPSAPGGTSSAAKSTASTAESVSAVQEVAVGKPASSDNTTLIGLIVLAAAGFFVYSKKSGVKGGSQANAEEYVAAGGATRVEQYLEKMGGNKTGVAKYLEKQTENPKTGVAKYMAKQIIKDRAAAEARQTGVERYLREKA